MISNEFHRTATDKTPEIVGDIKKGTLSIIGKSLPENAQLYYTSFRDWLGEFYKTEAMDLEVIFDLEYYNTSSSSIIIDILKNVKSLSSIKTTKVRWIYEEDDIEMREIGEDFKEIIGNIVSVEPKAATT